MVDAAGPESPLRNLESAPLSKQDVADRNADVFEDDL
jgi:hypothetical protein